VTRKPSVVHGTFTGQAGAQVDENAKLPFNIS